MKSFHRKRPHILPPLQNSYHSTLHSANPLQPPDLLLARSRFGSPIPRPSDPKEYDYVFNEDDIIKPIIKIDEPRQNNSRDLLKFDLLPSSTDHKTNNLRYQIQRENSERDEENLFKNLSKKKPDRIPHDLEKNIQPQTVLPLEKPGKTKTPTPEYYFQIPNRYKLLKPIGEGFLKSES